MIKLEQPIIVEGKYDKIKLSSIFDAVILTTDGFDIFKNKEKIALIKKLAEKNGVIILTDSDSAGGIIRSYLKNILSEDKIYNVFLPRIEGKEKRKTKASSEGLLGVEGTDKEIILKAFERFLPKSPLQKKDEITTAFLMSLGLSGGKDSNLKRKYLLNKLNLPYSISPATLKKVLSEISSIDEITAIMQNYK
jgi:ribonuclease M5